MSDRVSRKFEVERAIQENYWPWTYRGTVAIAKALLDDADALEKERDAARADADRLADALVACANELDRWGWGDHHYGDTPQEQSVVDAVAAARAVLASAPGRAPSESSTGDRTRRTRATSIERALTTR